MKGSFLKTWFQKLIKREDSWRLAENILSLTVLQGLNYLLPLLTLPYLTRVLGPEKFGLVAFAQALAQYFVIITDYGFNLSATRDISIHREDPARLRAIFNSVMAIKTGLMVLSLAALAVIVFSFDRFNRDWELYFLSAGLVLTGVLFPVWFFQGLERMKYITVLNIISRLTAVIAIFVFIRSSSDYLYVPLINVCGWLVGGVLSLALVFRDFRMRFEMPAPADIRYHLKEGWNIFVSGVAISMYTVTNTFLLGLFTSDAIVGYYSAAEKVFRALAQMFNPLFQALYPHIVALAQKSREGAINFLNKLLAVVLAGCSAAWLVIFLAAAPLLNIVLGDGYGASVDIFRIFSPMLIFTPAAAVFVNLAMLAFKLDRYFLRLYLFGGALNLALVALFLVILNMEANGVALAMLLNEIALTFLAYYILAGHHIKLFPRLRNANISIT